MEIDTFIMPQEHEELNEDMAEHYFDTYLNTVPRIKRVVETIEDALKERTGWSDLKIPDGVDVSGPIVVGNLELVVRTTPTTKSPSYKTVIDGIQTDIDYVHHLIEESDNKKRLPSWIKREFEDKTTRIELDTLLDKIMFHKERVSERGIKQEIMREERTGEGSELVPYYEGIGIPERIRIPRINYFELPDEAAILPEARVFYEEADKRAVRRFTELIKRDVAGGKLEAREERWRQVGSYLFHVWNTPSASVSYSDIYKALAGEAQDEKITKKTGELVLLARREDELIAPEILGLYDLEDIRRKRYISLEGFSKRLKQLYEENREYTVRQSMETFPLVWKAGRV